MSPTGMPDTPVNNAPVVERLYLTLAAIGHYAQKLLVPAELSIIYVKPALAAGLEPRHVALASAVLAGLGAGWLVLRKDKVGLFGLMFWIINLSLSLAFAFLNLRDAIVADRYVYLASVGFFLNTRVRRGRHQRLR